MWEVLPTLALKDVFFADTISTNILCVGLFCSKCACIFYVGMCSMIVIFPSKIDLFSKPTEKLPIVMGLKPSWTFVEMAVRKSQSRSCS